VWLKLRLELGLKSGFEKIHFVAVVTSDDLSQCKDTCAFVLRGQAVAGSYDNGIYIYLYCRESAFVQ
jgi:hypothetical protein